LMNFHCPPILTLRTTRTFLLATALSYRARSGPKELCLRKTVKERSNALGGTNVLVLRFLEKNWRREWDSIRGFPVVHCKQMVCC
jgi:hypothetical protein